MNKIGIGILLYRETDNAKKLLDDILFHEIRDIDFYFFDNGSSDKLFSDWLQSVQGQNIKILSTEKNVGFGGGAKHLLSHIPNEIRGYMPGNFKVKPGSLVNLAKEIEQTSGFQVFKAARSGRSKGETFKTSMSGILTSIYFGKNMTDSGGTPTLVKADLVELFKDGPNDYSFEAFFLFVCRKLDIKVSRYPIPYGTRLYGKSHWQSGFKSELNLLLLILSQKRWWNRVIKQSKVIDF
jgi:hypothetical protein